MVEPFPRAEISDGVIPATGLVKGSSGESGPASVAARPSIVAATGTSLDGQTGPLIGPEATPVPDYRGSTDPRTVSEVLKLSRKLAPLGDGR
ncbi:hypothetical protein [Streptomyces violaceusniger]|uniref:hypothetical protein n=1 Tax=Streptomyces violaceusniger TaxID=68280 RepID=UPI00123755D5|nr:hypothetical protein [Streptomyces violaceusniger]